MVQMNLSIAEMETQMGQKNRCMDTKKGEKAGGNELGDWHWHIYTIDIMYKIDD